MVPLVSMFTTTNDTLTDSDSVLNCKGKREEIQLNNPLQKLNARKIFQSTNVSTGIFPQPRVSYLFFDPQPGNVMLK
jgi:hypothetical protein